MPRARLVPQFRSIIRVAGYRASRPHGHPTWELSLYDRGVGVAIVGDERIPLRAGTIVCYPPGIAHQEHAEQALAGWFVHCDGAPWPTAPVPTGRDDGALARILALMHEQSLKRDRSHEARMQAWLDLLVAHLRPVVAAREPPHPAVERLQRAIADGFRDAAFSLHRAMRGLGLSADHLRRRFVAATGLAPREYLLDLRLKYARDLLAFGTSVGETAASVGFDDPYYFSRVFRSRLGVSPSDWSRHQSRM